MEQSVNVLLTPFKFLTLRSESGRWLLWRDLGKILLLAFVMVAPFLFLARTNFFADHGFMDRIGGLASVLTGFYVAALIAIATFSNQSVQLDEPIRVGKVLYREKGALVDDELTRREYVCCIFGYLAFMSLIISIFSIVCALISEPVKTLTKGINRVMHFRHDWVTHGTAVLAKVGLALIVAHVIVVTCHGLYYMTERIYAKNPVLLPRDD